MSGIDQYTLELTEITYESGHGEQVDEIKEVLNEIQENVDLDKMSYDEIVVMLGEPKSFHDQHFAAQFASIARENISFLTMIHRFNLVLLVLIPVNFFFNPFYSWSVNGRQIRGKTIFQLAFEYNQVATISGILAVGLLFVGVYYFDRKLYFSDISSVHDFFRIFGIYLLIMFSLTITIQITIIGATYNNFSVNYIGIERRLCAQDIDCLVSFESMWNFMQWFVVEMVTIPVILTLVVILYRIQINELAVTKFESMEEMDQQSEKIGNRIQRIYQIISGLILFVYFPIFFWLLFTKFFNFPFETSSIGLIISVTVITLLLMILFIQHLSVAYSHLKLEIPLGDVNFSYANNHNYLKLIGFYFISTTLPDYFFANTDGYIVIATMIASILLVSGYIIEKQDNSKWIYILGLLLLFSAWIFVLNVILDIFVY